LPIAVGVRSFHGSGERSARASPAREAPGDFEKEIPMTKSSQSLWDPETRVSFPRPERRAEATVQFEHDGVLFATAQCWDVDEPGPLPVAYFVQDHVPWGSWNRIDKAYYEMIVARCKADPTSKLCVASCDPHHLTLVFWPAEVDTSGLSTWEVFDPGVKEARVTFLKVRVLEHREPRSAEA